MSKNLFFSKKNTKFYYFFIIFSSLFFIYFIHFYISINKNYFIIDDKILNYYIIPHDKEGEKVKFLNKKSLNNLSKQSIAQYKINKIKNLKFTIQLFSSVNYKEVANFKEKFIFLKSDLIDQEELYIFSSTSEIGTDYFLSYKNFLTQKEALLFCNKSNILNDCLILRIKNE